MKYYFEDYKGKHYITLKKGSAEWINSDCPDILMEDGSYIVHTGGLNGWYALPMQDIQLLRLFRNFVLKSDKSFCKKYPDLGYVFKGDEGVVRFLDKELSSDILENLKKEIGY
jgi:hypothetical protein